MEKRLRSYLYVVTILFFTLGLFNVLFAFLGLICMLLPFVLLFKDRKKTWCQSYCPRASLFTRLFKGRSLTGSRGPDWLFGNGKWIMVVYFGFNLFVITMSTLRVARGLAAPMEYLRFLVAFVLPWKLPQLLTLGAPDWVIHLAYRIYSMMFTTTVLGMVLGWLFYPRTWCRICPISTLSDAALKKLGQSTSQAKGTHPQAL